MLVRTYIPKPAAFRYITLGWRRRFGTAPFLDIGIGIDLAIFNVAVEVLIRATQAHRQTAP